jgi:hypothetical protein
VIIVVRVRLQSDRSLEALDYAKPRSKLLPLDWTTTPLDYTSLVRPRSDWTEVALLTTLAGTVGQVPSNMLNLIRQRTPLILDVVFRGMFNLRSRRVLGQFAISGTG